MFYLFIFIFGLAIGSFLNVLIDRLPYEKSIQGRSMCDFCKHKLAWYDLIPVLSFFLLGGKCRYCKKKISWYYPTVELITAVLFVLTWMFLPKPDGIINFRQEPSLFLFKLAYFGVISSLIVIFFSDAKYHIIPDQIQISFLTFALILVPFYGFIPELFLNRAVSAILVALPIFFLYFVTRGGGMGFGDVKLAFIIGFFLGVKQGFLALYFAFINGALYGLFLILLGKKGLKSRIAFGPFLVLGVLFMLFFGQIILHKISQMYGF